MSEIQDFLAVLPGSEGYIIDLRSSSTHARHQAFTSIILATVLAPRVHLFFRLYSMWVYVQLVIRVWYCSVPVRLDHCLYTSSRV